MRLITYQLLVDLISRDALGAMQAREGLEVVLFELGAELFHHLREGRREGGGEGEEALSVVRLFD